MTGAEVLVETLRAAGVRQLFTLSGNHVLSVYDATVGRDLPLIHARHEAACVHMADGWGRLTETPGVALVTAGPGHLNAVAACYTALLAESPVVLLSGHAPRGQLGRGAFQELDQVGAARPATKAAWLVEEPVRIGDEVARALALAVAGRPGPVHLSLPGDVLEAHLPAESRPGRVLADPPPSVAESAVAAALDLLAGATRPLLLAGPAMGRPRRRAAAARLAQVTGIPLLVAESPRGVNDPSLRGAAGCLGEADVVLLLGKRLDFSLGFGQSPPLAPGCRVIRVDVEAGASRPDGRVALEIVADPVAVADALARAAGARRWPARRLGEGGGGGTADRAAGVGGAPAGRRRADPPAARLRGAPALPRCRRHPRERRRRVRAVGAGWPGGRGAAHQRAVRLDRGRPPPRSGRQGGATRPPGHRDAR